MKPVARVMGKELRWTRPRLFSRAYELRTDHDLVATLDFAGMRSAVAETANGTFRFNQAFGPAARIHVFRDGDEMADVAYRFRSGKITVRGGPAFPIRGGRWFRFENVVRDPRDEYELLRTTRHVMPLARPGIVEVAAPAWNLPELPMLLGLSWFMVIMRSKRAAH